MHATLTANFDGETLRLDEPLSLPPNTKVHVVVWTDEEAGEERRYWSQLGAEGLTRAYGDSEPEYTEADCIR